MLTLGRPASWSGWLFLGILTTGLSQLEIAGEPLVAISIIVRNEAASLPAYLGFLENLAYPKQDILVIVHTDHNVDHTALLLQRWIDHHRQQRSYREMRLIELHDEEVYASTVVAEHNAWTDARYAWILRLRQDTLDIARSAGAEYILFTDGDNYLVQPSLLKDLMAEKSPVVAPLLRVFRSETAYSNFWGAQTQQGFYKRSKNYMDIVTRRIVGCFPVPVVYGTFLVHLGDEKTDNFRFFPLDQSYPFPMDDLVSFSWQLKQSGMECCLLNRKLYGFLLKPLHASTTLSHRIEDSIHFLTDYTVYEGLPPLSPPISGAAFPKEDNMIFQKVFLINLARQIHRRNRALGALKVLGFSPTLREAVDGRLLTEEELKKIGVRTFPGFRDPYSKRPITMGEVGCFLSHYGIWKEMVENGLDWVLVLEDDPRFEASFRTRLSEVIDEAIELETDRKWDLMYLGRKILDFNEETLTPLLVAPSFSYWTLAYVLRLSGAAKLLRTDPISKLLPVDEFLPLMYDRQQDSSSLDDSVQYSGSAEQRWPSCQRLSGICTLWRTSPLRQCDLTTYNTSLHALYPVRDLVAISAQPLLIFPTHYVGDDGYTTDTEHKLFVSNELETSTAASSAADNITAASSSVPAAQVMAAATFHSHSDDL